MNLGAQSKVGLRVKSHMGRAVEGDSQDGVAGNKGWKNCIYYTSYMFVYPCHLNPVSASGRVAGSNPFSIITVARFARIYKNTNCLMY